MAVAIMMEKNAVLGFPHDKMEKRASNGCPLCGSALDIAGSLPRCPIHGTAPFESLTKIANGKQDPFRVKR